MKYVKMFALAAIAGAALMSFAGTASAANFTSPAGTNYTGTFHSTGHLTLDGSFVAITCTHSTTHGHVVSSGGPFAIINLTGWSMSGCSYGMEVKKVGSLSVSSTGAISSTGAEFSVATSVGTCIFTTNGTSVGSITDSSETGGNAVQDINSAKIPRTGGNFLCGSSGTMTGSHTVTSPSTFIVD